MSDNVNSSEEINKIKSQMEINCLRKTLHDVLDVNINLKVEAMLLERQALELSEDNTNKLNIISELNKQLNSETKEIS